MNNDDYDAIHHDIANDSVNSSNLARVEKSGVILLAVCLLVLLGPDISYSHQFHVTIGGTSSGDGSYMKPWDLQTALSHPSSVHSGDTILIHGGTYHGKFVSSLQGTEALPIIVMGTGLPGSANGVVIDGYLSTVLRGDIDATTTTLTLASISGIVWGSTFWIGNEQMYVAGSPQSHTISVERGWSGTMPTAHASGSPVILSGNVLTVNGGDVWFMNCEVIYSDTTRSGVLSNRGSIYCNADRYKLINLIVHDLGVGIFNSETHSGGEIYGCVVYNNGFSMSDRLHGHGLYIQNAVGRFSISDEIVFNNFFHGLQGVSDNGNAIGLHVDGSVLFNNGSPSGDPNYRQGNIIIGANAGYAAMDTITQCFTYHPSGKSGSIKLGYAQAHVNGNLVVKGNYFAGGSQALQIDTWDSVTVADNVLHVTKATGANNTDMVLFTPVVGAVETWGNNTYYNAAGVTEVFSPGRTYPLWRQETGFDSSSTYHTGDPTTNAVFVRPNAFQSKRAHIVIYNWQNKSSVGVDVSKVLSVGDQYEIRDVQHFFGAPVAVGTYAGGSIDVPMTMTGNAASPFGWDVPIASTMPRFGAFVLQVPPPTGELTVTPDTLPPGGGSVTLKWSSINATAVEMNPGANRLLGSGQMTVVVDSSREFTLVLAGNGGNTCVTRQVVVAQQPLMVPRFLSPLCGATLDKDVATLKWSRTEKRVTYNVQLSKDKSFSSPRMDVCTQDSMLVTGVLEVGTVYYRRICAITQRGISDYSPVDSFHVGVNKSAGIQESDGPTEWALDQNYPNPFNPTTTIPFALAASSEVTLSVYDMRGAEIVTLVSGRMDAGKHEIKWDASQVASGIYCYRLVAGSRPFTKRLLVLR